MLYTAVGYEVVGRAPETPIGELTMLKLPTDELVTIELVHDPTRTDDLGGGTPQPLRHHGRVEDATVAKLAARGIDASRHRYHRMAPTTFETTSIVDPDGNRIGFIRSVGQSR